MGQDDILAIARHLLGFAGSALVAHGYVSSAQWTAIAGGLIAVGTVAWSLFQKYQQRKAVAVALATPVPAK